MQGTIAMLPMNGFDPVSPVPPQSGGHGIAPALLCGGVGGLIVGGTVLWNGFGWLAALAAYALGGSLLMLGFAFVPFVEVHAPQPALRPAYARVRRRH
jgi:hypothetical protein